LNHPELNEAKKEDAPSNKFRDRLQPDNAASSLMLSDESTAPLHFLFIFISPGSSTRERERENQKQTAARRAKLIAAECHIQVTSWPESQRVSSPVARGEVMLPTLQVRALQMTRFVFVYTLYTKNSKKKMKKVHL
jgi:hypothetical protein